MTYQLHHADAFDWLEAAPPCSKEAVVTDPPYGLDEFEPEQIAKKESGQGGIWRQPPKLDGVERSPLPRFTVLTDSDKTRLRERFTRLAPLLKRVLVPGGHVFIACNPLVSHLVYEPFIAAGFEKRGEIIRTVLTLRGGDRPKGAEQEFPDVTVMPRSCWEPWGLFRKPCEGTVADNLRRWKTGGLRRISDEQPFFDLIESDVARGAEREISDHPALKPQAFMRRLVRAALPLGEGTILDPFTGSGSTIAAAEACDLRSEGIERDAAYFALAQRVVPLLAALPHEDQARRPRRAL